MNVNLKIGTWEAVATIGCISLIPILLTIPTYDVETFGTATFLHNIYTSILTFIVLFIILNLYKNFSNMDIIDISEYVGGKALKFIWGIILMFYLFTLCVLTFAEFTQNLQSILFTDAPQEYISILFGVAIVISLFLGIRGIFRTGSIIAPIITIGFILMFIALQPEIDLTNFFPIFGNDIRNFWLLGPSRIGRYDGIFFILLIIPYVKNYKKVGYFSFLMTAFLILPIIFLLVGIPPYPSIIEGYFPIFEITRLISFGRFIQRVESIFILLWLLATFIYLSLTLQFIILIFQKVFNLKYSERLIPLFSIITIATSALLSTFEIVIKTRNFVFAYISSLMLYVIPILLLIIAKIKRRRQCKQLIIQNLST